MGGSGRHMPPDHHAALPRRDRDPRARPSCAQWGRRPNPYGARRAPSVQRTMGRSGHLGREVDARALLIRQDGHERYLDEAVRALPAVLDGAQPETSLAVRTGGFLGRDDRLGQFGRDDQAARPEAAGGLDRLARALDRPAERPIDGVDVGIEPEVVADLPGTGRSARGTGPAHSRCGSSVNDAWPSHATGSRSWFAMPARIGHLRRDDPQVGLVGVRRWIPERDDDPAVSRGAPRGGTGSRRARSAPRPGRSSAW